MKRYAVIALAILSLCLTPCTLRAEPAMLQSSTSQTLQIGPVVASSDGKTPLTGLLTGSTITATGGSATTITSATSAGVGEYIKFAVGTTTAALQNVATWVTAVSGTGPYTLTVSPSLPASPTSTDTYNQANLGVLLLKNGTGQTYVPPAGTIITDAGLGYYLLTPAAGDTGTLGRLMAHWDVYGATGGISNEAPVAFVVAYNPFSSSNLGLTGVPASGTALTPAGLPSDYLSGTEQTQLSTTATQSGNAATSAGTAATQSTAANSGVSALSTKIGTPAGASVSADIGTANTGISALSTKIGIPAGASVSADIATANTAIAALPTATAIANAVLAAGIDGSITFKQEQALQLAIMTGKYTTSTTAGITTTTYYRQDGTTVLAVSTLTISNGTTTRTWTFSNLP